LPQMNHPLPESDRLNPQSIIGSDAKPEKGYRRSVDGIAAGNRSGHNPGSWGVSSDLVVGSSHSGPLVFWLDRPGSGRRRGPSFWNADCCSPIFWQRLGGHSHDGLPAKRRWAVRHVLSFQLFVAPGGCHHPGSRGRLCPGGLRREDFSEPAARRHDPEHCRLPPVLVRQTPSRPQKAAGNILGRYPSHRHGSSVGNHSGGIPVRFHHHGRPAPWN